MMRFDWFYGTYAFVVLNWIAFVVIFLARRRPAESEATEAKRDNRARKWIAMQGVGFGLAWGLHRRTGPIFNDALAPFVSAAACVIAVSSIALVMRSVQTLGKQWALAARLVEGHRLVTEGPYSLVRNPIYTGMFGMLIATALAGSTWWGLLLACVVFLIGTHMRVRVEEELLANEFGAEFSTYRQRVPALIPGLW